MSGAGRGRGRGRGGSSGALGSRWSGAGATGRHIAHAFGARRRRLARETDGTAAIEFAVVGAVLVVLSIALVELGRVVYILNDMSYATEIGSRRALVDPAVTDSALEDIIRGRFSAADGDGLTVVVTQETLDGLPFRRVALSYQVKVAIPGFPGGAIDLEHDRRIPVP
jgi:Flp pilus assembly protein TadG